MVAKGRSKSFDSPNKNEVGEIDTRAPIASVKAAVSLFGEVAFSGDKSAGRKPKPSTPGKESSSSEQLQQKPFITETQLHLAQKELNKYREQLQNAETTRVEALAELEKAKKTVNELTAKLTIINESKELALKAAEAAKIQTNQLQEDVNFDATTESSKLRLDQSREQYAAAITELDSAKQELRSLRKEFEALVEAKISAFNQESESKQKSSENAVKAEQLEKDIAEAQESLVHVKLATEQALQEESNIRAEKDSTRNSFRSALEENHAKLAVLKQDFNPELEKELELKLAETAAEIDAVRKQLEYERASDLASVKNVATELDEAKEVLQKFASEESSLRRSVETLKQELAAVMKDHSDLKEKDAETEALVADLHVKLQACKAELDSALAAESKSASASTDLTSALQHLQLETETSLQEAEAMKKEAETIRKETESARITLSETEQKLEVALKEAEAAKAAEALALEAIKNLSAKACEVRSSTSEESGSAEITISKEEFESLSRKVEESEKLTEMKVAAAAAQVEAVKASAAEAAKRLMATKKEIEEIEAAREDALKRAEMAEAAKKAVEGELKRWREKEQKRASEVAARLVEEGAMEVPPVAYKPHTAASEGHEASRKVGKAPAALKKSSSLLPTLSGIFHRKKNSIDGSPTHLPGDKEKNV